MTEDIFEDISSLVATKANLDANIEVMSAMVRNEHFDKLSDRAKLLTSSLFCTMSTHSFILGELIQELSQ